MRHETDDDVRRIHAVWLGPDDYTFPFQARYLAWATWFGLFMGALLILWVTPAPMNAATVIWSGSLAVVATSGVLAAVDHDKPLSAVAAVYWREIRGPRIRPDLPVTDRMMTNRVRVRHAAPQSRPLSPFIRA